MGRPRSRNLVRLAPIFFHSWTNQRGARGHVTSLHQSQLTWLQAGWPSHTRAGWTHTPDSGQMKYSGLVQARHRGPGPIRDEWTSCRPITAHLACRRRRGSGAGPRTRVRRGAAAGGRGRGGGGSGDPRNAPGADTARAAGTPGQTCRRCLMLADGDTMHNVGSLVILSEPHSSLAMTLHKSH